MSTSPRGTYSYSGKKTNPAEAGVVVLGPATSFHSSCGHGCLCRDFHFRKPNDRGARGGGCPRPGVIGLLIVRRAFQGKQRSGRMECHSSSRRFSTDSTGTVASDSVIAGCSTAASATNLDKAGDRVELWRCRFGPRCHRRHKVSRALMCCELKELANRASVPSSFVSRCFEALNGLSRWDRRKSLAVEIWTPGRPAADNVGAAEAE